MTGNTRRSQPYRRNGDRAPGPVLDQMLKGRGPVGDPAEAWRRQQKILAILRRLGVR